MEAAKNLLTLSMVSLAMGFYVWVSCREEETVKTPNPDAEIFLN